MLQLINRQFTQEDHEKLGSLQRWRTKDENDAYDGYWSCVLPTHQPTRIEETRGVPHQVAGQFGYTWRLILITNHVFIEDFTMWLQIDRTFEENNERVVDVPDWYPGREEPDNPMSVRANRKASYTVVDPADAT